MANATTATTPAATTPGRWPTPGIIAQMFAKTMFACLIHITSVGMFCIIELFRTTFRYCLLCLALFHAVLVRFQDLTPQQIRLEHAGSFKKTFYSYSEIICLYTRFTSIHIRLTLIGALFYTMNISIWFIYIYLLDSYGILWAPFMHCFSRDIVYLHGDFLQVCRGRTRLFRFAKQTL